MSSVFLFSDGAFKEISSLECSVYGPRLCKTKLKTCLLSYIFFLHKVISDSKVLNFTIEYNLILFG